MIDRATFVKRAGRLGLSAAAATAFGFDMLETPSPARADAPGSNSLVRGSYAASGLPTIKLGHVNGFTGVYAAQALATDSGVQLAIDEANTQYGGRVNFVAVRGDDTNSPVVGRYEAQRLIVDENVDVLLGQVSSGVAVEVSKIAQQYGVVYFTHGVDTDLTGPLANRVCFRTIVSGAMFSRALVPALIKDGKRWFFVVADYNFGRDAHRRLGDLLRASGGREVGSVTHKLGAFVFDDVVRAARASDADVLVFCNNGSDTNFCVKACVEGGLHRKMRFGGIEFDDQTIVGMPVNEIAGAQFGYLWGPSLNNSSATALYSKLRSRARAFPADWRQYLGYTTAALAIERIMSARTTDAETLIKSLENHTYDAGKATPNLVRDCDHQVVQDTYVATVLPTYKRRSPDQVVAITSTLDGKSAGGECDPRAAAIFAQQQQLPSRPGYTPIRDF